MTDMRVRCCYCSRLGSKGEVAAQGVVNADVGGSEGGRAVRGGILMDAGESEGGQAMGHAAVHDVGKGRMEGLCEL